MDTSAVIDLGKGREKILSIIRLLDAKGEELSISSITVFELAAGSPAGIEENRKKLIETFQIIPLSPEQAEKGALIYRKLRDEGKDIGTFDSLIAGVALIENEQLITANAKHFERVSGLQILKY